MYARGAGAAGGVSSSVLGVAAMSAALVGRGGFDFAPASKIAGRKREEKTTNCICFLNPLAKPLKRPKQL